MPQISIIIPVYKAERHLRECLDSIASQTTNDWEAILVDDGSPDKSGKICDEYASRDTRFKVVHQENGGPSKARNTGFDMSTAEIVTFLDADDWTEPDYAETILREIDGMDMVVFRTKMHKGNGEIKFMAPFAFGKHYGKDDVQKALDSVHRPDGQFGWPWNKGYRKETILRSGARFPEEMHFFEDQVFMMQLASWVKSLNLIDRQLHNYRVSENSLTTSKKTPEEWRLAGDRVDAEICRFDDPLFVSGFRNAILYFRLNEIQVTSKSSERHSRFQETYEYYHKHEIEIRNIEDTKRDAMFMHRISLSYLIFRMRCFANGIKSIIKAVLITILGDKNYHAIEHKIKDYISSVQTKEA